MRKRYKQKKRSCPLCNPHKMGWEPRFKVKELDFRNRLDKIARECRDDEW